MNNLLIFISVTFLGLIPFGIGVVWLLYRKTIVFPVALIVFFASMFCAIIAFTVAEYGWNTLYWAIPLCLIVLVSSNTVFKKIIQAPLKDYKEHLDKLAEDGDLEFKQKGKYYKYENEIGDIFRSFHKLGINLRKNVEFADEIAQGNFDANFSSLGEKDKIGLSLLNMRNSLIDAKRNEEKRKKEEEQLSWITNGIAKFSEILRQQNTSINDISYKLLSNLIDYVGAIQGGLFILNENGDDDLFYELTGAVAYGRKKSLNARFKIGESLIGRCAYEKQTIYMTDIPENYVNITSGLGESNPRSILLVPAVLNDKVFAIIELISFNEFDTYKIDFVEKLGETIASTFSSVKTNEQTNKLLEESKQKGEELAAQEEELRQNLEELQATQEELRRIQKEEKDNNEKMLEEVEKHRAALLKILDYVPMKIFLKDTNGNLLIVNQAVLDLYGNEREDMIGKNDFDYISDKKIAQEFFDKEQAIIKNGKIFNEIQAEKVGENNYMFDTNKIPFYIDYLGETGILGVQLDITDDLAMKERIKNLEAELATYKE